MPDIRNQQVRLLHDGFAKLRSTRFEFRRRDGQWQEVVREVHDHGDGAAVLLCSFAQGTVILIRQFRFPTLRSGRDGMLVEVCAGLIENGTPEECALREAQEETGIAPFNIQPVLSCFSSPGSVTEKIYLFIAEYDPATRSGGGGLASEGEDIEVLELPFPEALAMVKRGEIEDAKTILLLQHAALAGLFGG